MIPKIAQYVFLEMFFLYMAVSKNRGGPPKSSILIGFSLINHPFWGTPIFGNTHILQRFLVSMLKFVGVTTEKDVFWISESRYSKGVRSIMPPPSTFQVVENMNKSQAARYQWSRWWFQIFIIFTPIW